MKLRGYVTVDEMRAHTDWKDDDDGGTRFQGTTTPEIAFKYFSKNFEILECGPHLGAFTKLMIDSGYRKMHAVDFYDAIKFINKNKIDYKIIDLNTEKLPYPENFFQGVTAWGIGEHMENPYFFMREVHRVIDSDGYFIFALPNVFHIVSRLLFFKNGDFPRWNKSNNHITIFTHTTFKKTFLRYFDLVETVYTRPGIQYKFLNIFDPILPANEWFANYVVYVLKKKLI